MLLWNFLRRGWQALRRRYTEVQITIQKSFISWKRDLQRDQNWLYQPANRNRLVVKGVKYAVFATIFCGIPALLLGPQGALTACSWVAAWKLAEYSGITLPGEWFGRWRWFAQYVALGVTGVLWKVADWCSDRVSEGVQKVMEWFGAEFGTPHSSSIEM
ncbi:hypothetical protein FS749_002258 [Ceratobasidium sp. UAMH 11750]|nr:hypothetical protein FS749_002258 [Ceratobasidium sp. UAMH 11750]